MEARGWHALVDDAIALAGRRGAPATLSPPGVASGPVPPAAAARAPPCRICELFVGPTWAVTGIAAVRPRWPTIDRPISDFLILYSVHAPPPPPIRAPRFF
jgi:hypothetical protein